MAVDDEGKEPGGWELMRAFNRIEQTLQSVIAGAMTTQVFAIEKAALVAADLVQAEDITALKLLREADKKDIAEFKKTLEDQKSRNRLFVYGLVASPVVAAVAAFVINGGLSRA